MNDFIELDKILVLLENGAKPNIKTSEEFPFHGATSIHLICENPITNLDLLRLLIEKGADVNVLDSNKNSPLHLCCIHDRFSFAEFLLLHSSTDKSLKNSHGFTASDIALQKNLNCAKLFKK